MSNPPRKIRFIINPKSGIGKQKIVERRIETHLDKAAFDYEICYTQAKAHAIELSREAAQMGYAAVIAVGGDGTVNEVAQGLLHTNTAMGIIPAGSGNGLARFMKISLNVRRALLLINRYHVKTIDTGTINGKYYECSPFFQTVQQYGLTQAMGNIAGSANWLKFFLRGLPKFMEELKRSPQALPDFPAHLDDAFGDGEYVIVSQGDYFGLNLLPRFCRLIPDDLEDRKSTRLNSSH